MVNDSPQVSLSIVASQILPFAILLLSFFHHRLPPDKKKAPRGAFPLRPLNLTTGPAVWRRACVLYLCAHSARPRRSTRTVCSPAPFRHSYPGGFLCRAGARECFRRAPSRRRKL